jgi:hypothetical protein
MRRRFDPVEAIGLHVEAGGRAASSIEDLPAKFGVDLDGVEEFDSPTLKDGVEGVGGHGICLHVVIAAYLCCICNMQIG